MVWQKGNPIDKEIHYQLKETACPPISASVCPLRVPARVGAVWECRWLSEVNPTRVRMGCDIYTHAVPMPKADCT